LPALFITSQVQLMNNGKSQHLNQQDSLAFIDENDIQVAVFPAKGQKCVRCWKFSTLVGSNTSHPELCEFCLVAIEPQ
jgi:isoleucyl-tRNA synthetase